MLSGKHAKLTRARLDVWTSEDKPGVNLYSKLIREKLPFRAIRGKCVQGKKMRETEPESGQNGSHDATTGEFFALDGETFGEIGLEGMGTGETPHKVSLARAKRVAPKAAVASIIGDLAEKQKNSKSKSSSSAPPLVPIGVGHRFGPSWSTHWVHVEVSVPARWAELCMGEKVDGPEQEGEEAWRRGDYEVHLRFDSSCEAMLFDANSPSSGDQDPRPLQAFYGSDGGDRRDSFLLLAQRPGAYWSPENWKSASGPDGDLVAEFFIEVSCTLMFGVGKGSGWGGMGPTPSDPNKTFELKLAEVALVDRRASLLNTDFHLIAEMARHLPKKSVRAQQALSAANEIMNTCLLEDRSSWPQCQDIARRFLLLDDTPADSDSDSATQPTAVASGAVAVPSVRPNAHPMVRSQHAITSVGHCHIDTAWLWCYEETIRKVARSWVTQLRLMEQYSSDKANAEYVFVASQAQQFEWLEQRYPALFRDIVAASRPENGACFVPVGGTWVEMDCNIPSGESLARQFIYGQRYFKRHFGRYCSEFWLPDTFGYSAQLPQICKQAKIGYFLTQKLSWAQFNKFPNHTFLWEGLDGSTVLTHLPPTDTYCAQGTVKETLFHVKNYKESERSAQSLMLYGNGDGGGGPLPDMIERISRMRVAAGGSFEARFASPFTQSASVVDDGTPDEGLVGNWFRELGGSTKDITRWVGELYFELHRGTYTSHANNKKWNRQCEFLLHDVELYSAIASRKSSTFQYPTEVLDKCWKLVLLQQFHDVIPGSSVHEVYRDSDADYAEVMRDATAALEAALGAITQQMVALDAPEYQAQQRQLRQMRYSLSQSKDADAVASPPQKKSRHAGLNSERADADMGAGGDAASMEKFLVNPLPWRRTTITPTPGGHAAVSVPASSVVQWEGKNVDGPPASRARVVKTSPDVWTLENSEIQVQVDRFGRLVSLIDVRNSRSVLSGTDSSGAPRFGNQFFLHEDVPMYWDAWDVDVYHLEKYALVPNEANSDEDGSLEVECDDGVVAAVRTSFYLNSKTGSRLEQVISIDAYSRQVKFDVTVDWRETHQFLKVEFPTNIRSMRATYETQFGSLERPTHFNTVRVRLRRCLLVCLIVYAPFSFADLLLDLGSCQIRGVRTQVVRFERIGLWSRAVEQQQVRDGSP
jgi:alpha-mannosidase